MKSINNDIHSSLAYYRKLQRRQDRVEAFREGAILGLTCVALAIAFYCLILIAYVIV